MREIYILYRQGGCWWTLKAPITPAADDKFWDILPNFWKKRYDILWESSAGRWLSWNIMPYLLFLKKEQIWNCRLLQIIGGALWVKTRKSAGPKPLPWRICPWHVLTVIQLPPLWLFGFDLIQACVFLRFHNGQASVEGTYVVHNQMPCWSQGRLGHVVSLVKWLDKLTCQGNQLCLTAPPRSESMLIVCKNVIVVQVSHDAADNYVLEHLKADAGQGHRPLVTGFDLFTLFILKLF